MGGNKNPQPCWVCSISVRSLSAHRKTKGHLEKVEAKAPLPPGFLTRFGHAPTQGIPATKCDKKQPKQA